MLTQEYLKECMKYDRDTGKFTWRIRPERHFSDTITRRKWNSRWSGKSAGCYKKYRNTKYLVLTIDYEKFFAHRLVFLYLFGRLPVLEVDHINHNGEDNRFENLGIRIIGLIDTACSLVINSDLSVDG